MKIEHRSKVIGFLFIILVIFYFIYKKDKVVIDEGDKSKIENFDIILSKGQSLQSKLIGLLKFSIEDYSHIGIITKDKDKVFVLHSTPDGTNANGIRYDDLQTFLDISDVSDYTILRYQNISFYFRQRLRIEFDKYISTEAPFDFNFNNYENRKIYCSELIWIIFNNSGLFEINDFNLSKPIYPKYFLKMNKLVAIDLKKTIPHVKEICNSEVK